MFLKVKGVPAIYLPHVLPAQQRQSEHDFLMPSYGSSSYKDRRSATHFLGD
jgi:hypothetical protein